MYEITVFSLSEILIERADRQYIAAKLCSAIRGDTIASDKNHKSNCDNLYNCCISENVNWGNSPLTFFKSNSGQPNVRSA